MTSEKPLLKEIQEVLKEIQEQQKMQTLLLRTWLLPELRQRLVELLDSDTKKKIYHLSDGRRSSRDISKKADVSHVTVINNWKEWKSLGFVVPSERYKGRFRKVIPLDEIGIAIDEVAD